MIQWKAHNGCVRALSYSPDGAILVSGGHDHSLGVWDPVSGERRADVRHEFLSIEELAFSPGGRLLAFATGRRVVVVCDRASLLRDGPLTDAIAERTGEAGVWSVAFSADGRNLVTAGGLPGPGSRAILWDVTAFKRGRRPGEPDPHIDALNFTDNPFVTAAYAPDGRAVALGGGLGTIVLWPYPIPWDHLRRRDEPFDRVAYDRHVRRSRVAEVTAGSRHTDTIARVADSPYRTTLTDAVARVAFSPDGTTLAAAVDNVVVLWDYQHPDEKPPIVSNRRLLRGHARYVPSLAFAPDGRTIATVSWDGTLRVWDPRESFELSCLDAGVGPLWGLALAPDGMTVAVGGEGGEIIIIDMDERL
jgi:WD40 repeat protein